MRRRKVRRDSSAERGAGGSGVKAAAASDVYAVVLIGGKGKRLRPLSTDEKPKAFLSVTRDRLTMFQRTVRRARKIIPLGHLVAVANARHLRHVRRDLPGLDPLNLLLEPVARNTAPAIGLAARFLEKRAGDRIMVVLPTDQYILDEDRYVAALRKGVAFVRRHPDALIVIGHAPSYPATQFGYIRIQGPGAGGRGTGVGGIYRVASFTEKPDLRRATRYVKSRRYLWNTGAFIFRTGAILGELRRHAPDVFRGLERCRRITARSYARIPDISIDYAVMEKAAHIYCVKGAFRWQDMGSFDALREILRREGRRYREQDGVITRIL